MCTGDLLRGGLRERVSGVDMVFRNSVSQVPPNIIPYGVR